MTAVPRHRPQTRELDDLTVARAARGDDVAFRALVEHYQRPIVALVWRMLAGRGDTSLVDDLTQETFVQVHGSLPRFSLDGAARLSTWILTIATRVVLHHLRRRRLPFRSLGPRAEAVAARESPHRDLEWRERSAAVARALARLTPEQRAIVILRDLHELEYQEIAQALELEPGTVKSRLSRARAALRAALDKEYPR